LNREQRWDGATGLPAVALAKAGGRAARTAAIRVNSIKLSNKPTIMKSSYMKNDETFRHTIFVRILRASLFVWSP
jgi:hypothetical protein